MTFSQFTSKLNWRLMAVHLVAYWFIFEAAEYFAILYDYNFVAGFYRHYHNGFHFTKEELHSMPDGYLSRLIHDNYVILVWPLIGLPIALILSLSISIIRKWFWLNPVIVFIVVLSLKVLWAQEKIATTPWTFLQYVFNKPGYFFKGSMWYFIANGLVLLAIGLYLLFAKSVNRFIEGKRPTDSSIGTEERTDAFEVQG